MVKFDNGSYVLKDKPYDYKTLSEKIESGSLPGSKEWTGWYEDFKEGSFDILETLKPIEEMRSKAKTMIVIGIGGSYLGSKAIDFALSQKNEYQLLFAGINLSSDYLNDVVEYAKNNDFVLCYITKSGTTLEPAIAFRLLKNVLVDKYGAEALQERLVVITGQDNRLRAYAQKNDVLLYDVPETTGGRYSVFTHVGLVPLAFMGYDLKALLQGAYDATSEDKDLMDESIPFSYAKNRYDLYNHGHAIEAFVVYQPKLNFVLEWIKQLFGESEGKGGKGLFPVSLNNTTDLHSLGQMVQDGNKILFESVIKVNEEVSNLEIPFDQDDFDGLNQYLNYSVSQINNVALQGTKLAHQEGGVVNLEFELDQIDAYHLGYLMGSMMIACMYSAYMIGVNPFDQPGVEVYKKEIYKILNESDKND